MTSGNLFANVPVRLPTELFEVLWQTPTLKVERIISRGHATPSGEWLHQETDEWVVLLRGSAGLRLDGRDELLPMKPGDFVLIPAHVRHRVDWTDADADTIWVAVHGKN